MKQIGKMPALGEAHVDGDENIEPRTAPLSFAAVVKSAKFLEAAVMEFREMAQLKTTRQENKVADEKRGRSKAKRKN